MFNDSTLKSLRKIVDGSSRPIFVPGYEMGVPGGMPDRLLGDPITINQSVATMAASAKSILYGDFSFYKIRDVMGIELQRYTDSAYAKKGQVGFLAFLRSGGNLIDVGGAVKLFVNAAS
jgi:HK97 family phage major capsid protein